MFSFKIDNLPKKLIINLMYKLYYTINWYVFFLCLFIVLNYYSPQIKLSDYALFMGTLIFSVPFWWISSYFYHPYEIKTVKRNIFVVWLINVLKNNKKISYKEIVDNYWFMIFQSKKVTFLYDEYAKIISALVALDIIKLENHSELVKCSNWNFDEKFINEYINDLVLSIKDKKINIDELIIKLDNYIL